MTEPEGDRQAGRERDRRDRAAVDGEVVLAADDEARDDQRVLREQERS
jgi:hypothetical protein